MQQLTDLFRFKGEDKFEPGKIYMLDIVGANVVKLPGYPPRLMPCINSCSPSVIGEYEFVPYESWESFFDNWERV